MTAIWDKITRQSLDEITGLSRQRRWQLRQIHSGRCEKCGRLRGVSGTETRCAKHAGRKSKAGKRAA